MLLRRRRVLVTAGCRDAAPALGRGRSSMVSMEPTVIGSSHHQLSFGLPARTASSDWVRTYDLSICLLHSSHWPYTLAVGNAPMKSMGRAPSGHQPPFTAAASRRAQDHRRDPGATGDREDPHASGAGSTAAAQGSGGRGGTRLSCLSCPGRKHINTGRAAKPQSGWRCVTCRGHPWLLHRHPVCRHLRLGSALFVRSRRHGMNGTRKLPCYRQSGAR